jgi:DNA-directed RNA polymerase beta subunit
MQDAEQGPLFPRPLDEPVADCLVAPQIARDAAESLLLDQGLLAHHIDSMNSFWSKELPQIVQENATIVYEYKKGEERWVVRFSHLEIERPTMTDAQGTVHRLMPHEALLLRQTYAAKQRNTITVWKQVRMLKKLVPDQVIDRDSDIPLASTAQLVQDGPAAAALSEDRIVVLTKKRQQKYYWHTVEEYINRDCRFCDIPVMIGSSPCYLSDGTTSEDKNLSVDPRGYFVVEGQEKVCIAQEKPRYNRVFVYRD